MVSPFGGSSTALKFLVGHLNKGIHSFIHSFIYSFIRQHKMYQRIT